MLELWQKNFFQQINKQVHLNKLLDPLPCVPKNVLHGIQKMSLIKKKKREEGGDMEQCPRKGIW